MLRETVPGRPQYYLLPQDNPARGGGRVQQLEDLTTKAHADPLPQGTANTSATEQPTVDNIDDPVDGAQPLLSHSYEQDDHVEEDGCSKCQHTSNEVRRTQSGSRPLVPTSRVQSVCAAHIGLLSHLKTRK